MLAPPAAAWGQSAGDDQYEDPFAPGNEQPEAPADTPTPAAESAPAPSATVQPAAAAAQQQLPYTGGEAGFVALGGVVLLAGGVALRLRLR